MANPLSFLLPAATIGLGAILINPARGFIVPGAKPFSAQAVIEEHGTDDLEITEHPVEQGAPITDHAYKRPSEVRIRCVWSASPAPAVGGLLGAAVGAASALGGPLLAAAAAGLPTLQAIQSILSGNSTGQPADTYKKLLALQVARVPFTLLTGKRSYDNMLMKSVAVETTRESENCLEVVAICKQVIIVATTIVAVSSNPAVQSNPESTSPVVKEGPQSLLDAPNLTPDLSSLSGSVTTLQNTLSSSTSMLSQVAGGISSLPGAVTGVIGQLPDVLNSATAALTAATNGLPGSIAIPSFEIPSFPNAAEINVALNPASISDAMKALPSTLETTQNNLTSILSKLPTIQSQLPTVLSGLSGSLSAVQTSISTVVNNVAAAIARAPIGGA